MNRSLLNVDAFGTVTREGDPEVGTEITEDGLWIVDCPKCSLLRPTCAECNGTGRVLMDPQEPMEACKWEDHRWKLRIEDGHTKIVCIDPHSREEREAMRRNERGAWNYKFVCCDPHELSDFGDAVQAEFEVDLTYVFEPGTYEYPDETSYWIDVKPLRHPPSILHTAVHDYAMRHVKVDVTTTDDFQYNGYIVMVDVDKLILSGERSPILYYNIKDVTPSAIQAP